jgi:hypothetical protein
VPKPSSGNKESIIIPGPGRPKVDTQKAVQEEAKQPRKEGEPNMDLDSFEKVMAAMEAELEKARRKNNSSGSASKTRLKPPPGAAEGGGKKSTSSANPLPPLPTEADLEAMDEDDLLAMDRELRAALKGAGVEDPDDEDMPGELDVEEAKGLEGEERREYEMMREVLESYRSQEGGSGVVGNMFGRLGEMR